MSAQFANVKSYPVSVSNQDIPSAWMSNQDPRVASATKRIVNVSSSTGTQTAGGLVSFILPAGQGAGFLVSGSAYIKMNVSVTQETAYNWAFAQYGSASSVVNRMTLLSSGSISEQILNYNKTYSALLLHASNPSFACGDDKLNQRSFNGAANTAQTITVAIPILLGAFNSKNHYPLCLINSAQLNVDLDTLVNAISQINGATAPTEYSVSSASLVFEQCVPDNQYEQGLRAMLASGRLFQMPISTFYNVRTAQTGAVTQNIGLNCSSLKAILWSTVPAETLAGSKQFTDGGQTSARLYLDGSLQFAGNLSDEISQFLEMNRALNTMWDSDRVSCAPTTYVDDGVGDVSTTVAGSLTIVPGGITRDLYKKGAYLGGLSCAKSSESGFSMKGVPVNSAVLEFVGSAGGTFYITCCVEQVLTFDAMGNASLIR